jgi:hypothetical protein
VTQKLVLSSKTELKSLSEGETGVNCEGVGGEILLKSEEMLYHSLCFRSKVLFSSVQIHL